MNPLTNIKNVIKMNDRELEMGVAGTKSSWHYQYRDSAWIFLGGLPFELTEGDILSVFSQFGEIVHINLIRDHETGKSKGFGFLCYMDQRSTVLTVDNLNGIKLCGRTVRVDHVETYKLPKDLEKLDDDRKRLFLEGCAPKVLEPDPMSEEEEDTLPVEKKPKKSKKSKQKKKKKKRKRETSSSNSSDSASESDEDRRSSKKGPPSSSIAPRPRVSPGRSQDSRPGRPVPSQDSSQSGVRPNRERSGNRKKSRSQDRSLPKERRDRSRSRDRQPRETPRSRGRSGSRDRKPLENPRSRGRSGSRDRKPVENPRSRGRSGSRDRKPVENPRSRGRSGSRDRAHRERSQSQDRSQRRGRSRSRDRLKRRDASSERRRRI